MHIPDGYLSPIISVGLGAATVPGWAIATNRVQKVLSDRTIPLLAVFSAMSFTIMMFNIPVPGGTTAHGVGGTLIAIVLGPWAAAIAVSVALIIQALFFGDGGVLAIFANCLNMAVIMPFTGWWAYRLIAGRSSAKSKRRWLAAALGSYLGLNAAALSAAFMFGIQPALAHDPSGRALYCPFGLGVALPAMTIEHLLIFGIVEALVTGLVVAYLSRSEPALLEGGIPAATPRGRMPLWKKLALGLGVLVLLAPLGLVLPAMLGASEAWGEWGGERVQELAGYIPAGMQKVEALWRAPMPDYAPKGSEEATLPVLSIWYILSGMLGVAVVAGLFIAARRLIARKETDGIAP